MRASLFFLRRLTAYGVTGDGPDFLNVGFGVLVGDTHAVQFLVVFDDNLEDYEDDTAYSSWDSSDTDVASVSYDLFDGGLVAGNSGGAAFISASDGLENPPYVPYQCFPAGMSCPISEDVLGGETEVIVEVPTLLGGPTSTKTVYTGGTLYDCYGQVVTSPFYGYEECEAYTVLDQYSDTIYPEGLQFDEDVQVVDTNVGLTSSMGSGVTDSTGILRDMLALGSAGHAPNPGDYAVEKQTITLHSTGATVRVNCLDKEYTDVSVTDITSAPGTTCTR